MNVAEWFVILLQGYAVVGLLLAVPFVFSWVKRVDPVAAEGTWGFRLLILPGAAALWPVVLWKLVRGSAGDASEGGVS